MLLFSNLINVNDIKVIVTAQMCLLIWTVAPWAMRPTGILMFLAHPSCTQVNFSDYNFSVVRRHRCRCCRKFFTFLLLLQNHRADFNQIWYKASLGEGDIQVCSNEGPCPFPREDNNKRVKMNWRNLKIFNQTWHRHSWGEGIQVSLNNKIAKIH